MRLCASEHQLQTPFTFSVCILLSRSHTLRSISFPPVPTSLLSTLLPRATCASWTAASQTGGRGTICFKDYPLSVVCILSE
ncbi:hypothetical protein PSPO01_04101 [Paraphaeosphaeria sporulosa]